MVNKLKNNSTQGAYLLINQGGWVAANTPGEADLDLLTLGNNYIYFDSVMRLEHRISTTSDGGESSFVGHNLNGVSGGQTRDWSGGVDKGNLILLCEVDSITGTHIKSMVKRQNRLSVPLALYLVRQYASETFELFPNHDLVHKKYIEIVTSGVMVVELEGIQDRKQMSLGMWEMWGAYAPL